MDFCIFVGFNKNGVLGNLGFYGDGGLSAGLDVGFGIGFGVWENKEALNGQYTEVEGGITPGASAAVMNGSGRHVGQTFTVSPQAPLKLPPFAGHTTQVTGTSTGLCP